MATLNTLNLSTIQLFFGTLVSALLLFFGIGVLGFMFLPVIISPFASDIAYHPQLPIAEARTEEFLDINQIPFKQFYPAIASSPSVEQGNWIRIPSINVNVPLVASASVNDSDVLRVLDAGAALYPNGVSPGHLGNVFIAAHSTGEPWKGKYRFAFLQINEVQPGNIIQLDYEGTRYTYRVTGSETIHPSPDYQVVSDRPVPTVTLMACWPLWSTEQRMLVRGELTSITKLTP